MNRAEFLQRRARRHLRDWCAEHQITPRLAVALVAVLTVVIVMLTMHGVNAAVRG